MIDSGNTTTHFGICDRNRILYQFRVPSVAQMLLRDACSVLKRRAADRSFSGVLIGSVVPRLNPSLELLCTRVGLAPVWLNHRTATGIRLLYKKPSEIGADRIANSVAAKELYGVPAIVVDIGTAITFDCISGAGSYLGGVIAPGPVLSRTSLAERTGLLPFVDIKIPPRIIGTSTARAIRAGVVYGTRSLIVGVVGALRSEMKGTPRVIFTGGQLALIVRGWNYPKTVDPFLTLQGLRIIYNRTVGGSQ